MQLLVICVRGWVFPFRLLELLVPPCVDRIGHHRMAEPREDAPKCSAQHFGDGFAEVLREGMLLNGRQAVGDNVLHL